MKAVFPGAFSFIALFFLLSSCMKEVIFKEVIINNLYSVSLPEYLSPTTQLNDKATFQYQNEEKDLYVLVFYESREDLRNYDMDYSLEEYFKKLTAQGLVDQIKNGKITHREKKLLNENPAISCQIHGIIGNAPIVYNLTVIESKEYFFQLLIWTREDTRKNLEKDIAKITESFRVIPQKAQDSLPEENSITFPDSVSQ